MPDKPNNAEKNRRKLDDALDEALDESFPASDPVAIDRHTRPNPVEDSQ